MQVKMTVRGLLLALMLLPLMALAQGLTITQEPGYLRHTNTDAGLVWACTTNRVVLDSGKNITSVVSSNCEEKLAKPTPPPVEPPPIDCSKPWPGPGPCPGER